MEGLQWRGLWLGEILPDIFQNNIVFPCVFGFVFVIYFIVQKQVDLEIFFNTESSAKLIFKIPHPV